MKAKDKCWCGVERPYYAPIERDCGGLGVIQCLCGGDMCVCHWHGEYECPGCDECRAEKHDQEFYDEQERHLEPHPDDRKEPPAAK